MLKLSMATAQVETQRGQLDRVGLASACAIGFAFSANYTNHAPMIPALVAQFKFSLVPSARSNPTAFEAVSFQRPVPRLRQEDTSEYPVEAYIEARNLSQNDQGVGPTAHAEI
jgi:hypothetical protein